MVLTIVTLGFRLGGVACYSISSNGNSLEGYWWDAVVRLKLLLLKGSVYLFLAICNNKWFLISLVGCYWLQLPPSLPTLSLFSPCIISSNPFSLHVSTVPHHIFPAFEWAEHNKPRFVLAAAAVEHEHRLLFTHYYLESTWISGSRSPHTPMVRETPQSPNQCFPPV